MSGSGRLPPLSSSYPHPGANISLSMDGGLPSIMEENPTPARKAAKESAQLDIPSQRDRRGTLPNKPLSKTLATNSGSQVRFAVGS